MSDFAPQRTFARRAAAALTAAALVWPLAGCGGGHATQAAAGPAGETEVGGAASAKAAGVRCPGCNVLLISIDTLRADHLGAYGYHRPTSPHLDRLAAESVLFDRCINTGGGTLPVHTSMFTSLPPTVHGIWADSQKGLDPARVTLAQQLKQGGYQTRGYTGGGFVRAVYGLGKGFDFFYDQGGDFKVEMPMLNQWLDGYRGGKFFLFLHTYDVHSDWARLPYDAPDGFNDLFTAGYHGGFDGCAEGRCASKLLVYYNQEIGSRRRRPDQIFTAEELAYVIGLYDGGIAYVDRELERLFERLKAMELYDKTLIVFTSDHGEEFLEHHLLLHDQNYEEEAHVPLLIRFPHAAEGGRRVAEMVSTLDLMPTILDAVGIAPNPEIRGRSVLPLLAGRHGRDFVWIAGGLPKLRTPDWSLVAAGRSPFQLFDLTRDPAEKHNVLAAHPAQGRELMRRMRSEERTEVDFANRLRHSGQETPIALAEWEKARLRALGYLPGL
jgi:arylsulfatase A-like enzyme